jgi:GxxExxY protein
MEKDLLTEKIIGCCFKVHTELGPGFKERIYHNALKIQLSLSEMSYETEKEFNVSFNNTMIGKFKCDLVIESSVIVELKSIEGFIPTLFHHQLLSYLKASKIKTGLLINFGNKSCEVKRFSV